MIITKISTKNMTREDWLKHRSKSIGGSDAAAILGLNQYSSPYCVWADKTGRLPEKEDSEAMRQGRELEQYVADRFMDKTGKKVVRNNNILINSDYPFAHANIDRSVVGENAGLECKTTSAMNLSKFKNGEYPTNYYVQCVHYMAVTGCDKWYLAVLILNKDFLVFEIERDEYEIKALMDEEKRFYEEYILKNTPPPVDGLPSTSEAIRSIFTDCDAGSTMQLVGANGLLNEYFDLKKESEEIDLRIEKIKQSIQEEMKNNESAMCDIAKITWKTQTKTTYDIASLSKDFPEIDFSKYLKQSTFRLMRITKLKEAK